MLGSTVLRAQGGSQGKADAWNYAVPESPALTFLGDGTAKVSRPLSARDLATQLVNAIDTGGRVRQGIAIDFTPSYVTHHRISLQDYQRNVGAYALANTQISFGTVRSSGDSGSTDISLGLRTVFFDRGDPMRDAAFTSLLDDTLAHCEPATPPIAGNTMTDADRARIAAEFESCASGPVETMRKAWLNQHWNASSFGIGAASGYRFQGSRLNKDQWIGYSVWGTGSFALGHSGLLAGQLQVDYRKGPAGLASQTILHPGGRLLVGSATFDLYAEVITAAHLNGAKSDTSAQWTGGVEFKAGPNLWIATGFGSRFTTGAQNKILVLANVRWVVSQNSRFSPVTK